MITKRMLGERKFNFFDQKSNVQNLIWLHRFNKKTDLECNHKRQLQLFRNFNWVLDSSLMNGFLFLHMFIMFEEPKNEFLFLLHFLNINETSLFVWPNANTCNEFCIHTKQQIHLNRKISDGQFCWKQ